MLTSLKLTVLDGYTRGIAVCFLMLSGLTSCIPVIPATPTLDVGDGGFLSEEPCGPPCFWGIVPGETTEAEVVEILQERGVLETCEAFDNEADGGSRGIKCGSRIVISFERGDDGVQGVGFNPTSMITVQEVVAKYGEPEGVKVGALGVHGMTDAQLIMVYPIMLTLVRFSIQDEGPYILEPSTPVRNITYAVIFDEEFSLDWEEWHGYGEYR
jgi:hypothetical protein